jgi:hypothetical protein
MIEDNGDQLAATRQRRPRTDRKPAPTTFEEDGKPKRKRGPGRRRTELNARVIQDLAALRGALDEMLEHYAIRVAGQLSELMLVIQGDGNVDQKPRPLTVEAAEAMLQAIRDANLKPKKGRGKDFVRVQKLVKALRALGPVEG